MLLSGVTWLALTWKYKPSLPFQCSSCMSIATYTFVSWWESGERNLSMADIFLFIHISSFMSTTEWQVCPKSIHSAEKRIPLHLKGEFGVLFYVVQPPCFDLTWNGKIVLSWGLELTFKLLVSNSFLIRFVLVSGFEIMISQNHNCVISPHHSCDEWKRISFDLICTWSGCLVLTTVPWIFSQQT